MLARPIIRMRLTLPRLIGVVVAAPLFVAIPTQRVFADESPRARAASTWERIALQFEKPSVHDTPEDIATALRAAGVTEETIVALQHAVRHANLPSMASDLDAFLFFTRDPQWLALRHHFVEFLELADVLTIDGAIMRAIEHFDGVVTFPAVTELSVEAATACQPFGTGSFAAAIELPAVSEITPKAAAALARCEALLVFPHLRELTVETARALAQHEGMGLVLGGLTTLEPDVAEALSNIRSERGLLVPDLVVLDSVPLARQFARQDHAFMPAVRRLTPQVAAALRGNDGGELALPSLEEVPPTIAKELVGAGYYWLTLGGASTLSPDAAAILAKHNGPLEFTGPEPFSATAAGKLTKHPHAIILPHVAAIPAEVARSLAPHESPLVLGNVSHLTADVAARLAEHKGILVLPAIERLTPEVAALLAPRLASIELPGLLWLDAETAAALVAHAGDSLEIPGAPSLTPDVAMALAAFEGALSLPNVTSLTLDTARALASHRGMLRLAWLEDLDPAVAAVLAEHAGGLDLSGVQRLSAALGAAIATTRGPLVLGGVSAMDGEAARSLAARTDPLTLEMLVSIKRLDSPAVAELLVKHFDNLTLDSLTSLTGPEAAEIARILVQTRGTLGFRSLERISPRALEVLLGRPGTVLPDLNDVTIVPDVGQLGNDDFIEPRR